MRSLKRLLSLEATISRVVGPFGIPRSVDTAGYIKQLEDALNDAPASVGGDPLEGWRVVVQSWLDALYDAVIRADWRGVDEVRENMRDCVKISEGGTNMRAAGESPARVEEQSALPGNRSDDLTVSRSAPAAGADREVEAADAVAAELCSSEAQPADKVKRPKAGDEIRFRLRYGSAPATVIERVSATASKVQDHRFDSFSEKIVDDIDVCYIGGQLTGNDPDEEDEGPPPQRTKEATPAFPSVGSWVRSTADCPTEFGPSEIVQLGEKQVMVRIDGKTTHAWIHRDYIKPAERPCSNEPLTSDPFVAGWHAFADSMFGDGPPVSVEEARAKWQRPDSARTCGEPEHAMHESMRPGYYTCGCELPEPLAGSHALDYQRSREMVGAREDESLREAIKRLRLEPATLEPGLLAKALRYLNQHHNDFDEERVSWSEHDAEVIALIELMRPAACSETPSLEKRVDYLRGWNDGRNACVATCEEEAKELAVKPGQMIVGAVRCLERCRGLSVPTGGEGA